MAWISRPLVGCWATTAPGSLWTLTPMSPPRHSAKRQIPWRISSPVLLRTKRTFPRMGRNLGLVEKQKMNHPKKCRETKKLPRFPRKSRELWLRGPDLNRRPSGYELRLAVLAEAFWCFRGVFDSCEDAFRPCSLHWFHLLFSHSGSESGSGNWGGILKDGSKSLPGKAFTKAGLPKRCSPPQLCCPP